MKAIGMLLILVSAGLAVLNIALHNYAWLPLNVVSAVFGFLILKGE